MKHESIALLTVFVVATSSCEGCGTPVVNPNGSDLVVAADKIAARWVMLCVSE